MSIRTTLGAALDEAARSLGVAGEMPDLELTRARNAAHGDFASSAGMKLARVLRRPPAEIAAALVAALKLPPEMATAAAEGGYVNLRLSPAWLQRVVSEAAAGESYGAANIGRGELVQVEYLSTNPTGPLHIGHGRGAIIGDSLATLLAFTGHQVEREYYVNDFGNQAHKFGASILARLRDEDPPEGGYQGEYVNALAARARQEGIAATEEALMAFGLEVMVAAFQAELARLGVNYDAWFSERSLWESGDAQEAIGRLRAGGYLKERDGATWFAPALQEKEAGQKASQEAGQKMGQKSGQEVGQTQEHTGGDDEDRVVFRSNGVHTYFASDLGYLLNRFERRGYHRVIEVWGADHHGYVPRMKQACAALGIEADRLVILLNQFVTLKEGKMSKRSGRFVTLAELLDRVGADAVRWFYLSRSPDTMMEFDLELATTQNRTNPVFYVQYAHARLNGIERAAAERELPATAQTGLLVQPWELDVARQLAHWPDAVAEAARLMEPHRIPYFLYELADRVSTFYEAGNDKGDFRVVVPDPDLTRARLELCRAARATLRTGLELMGVTAPDRMDRTAEEI